MKDKLLQIRVDAEFVKELEYLQKINGYKTIAETIRKIVDKEFRKECNQDLSKALDELEEFIYKEYYDGGFENCEIEMIANKLKELKNS